jgi:hypothetical protein
MMGRAEYGRARYGCSCCGGHGFCGWCGVKGIPGWAVRGGSGRTREGRALAGPGRSLFFCFPSSFFHFCFKCCLFLVFGCFLFLFFIFG